MCHQSISVSWQLILLYFLFFVCFVLFFLFCLFVCLFCFNLFYVDCLFLFSFLFFVLMAGKCKMCTFFIYCSCQPYLKTLLYFPVTFTGEPVLPDPCSSFPCMNGASCRVFVNNDFFCDCTDGYTGDRCQTRKFQPPDTFLKVLTNLIKPFLKPLPTY